MLRKFECHNCKTKITLKDKMPTEKRCCNNPDWLLISSENAIEKLRDPKLIDNTIQLLSEDYIRDDKLKMTAFLVAISGLSADPNKRMSMALTGNSSVGKDHLIKTILRHMPNHTYKFLTGTTKASIEDELKDLPILALSEMNLFRESGANRELLEVVKQRTEGGTHSIKKDVSSGYKTSKEERGEQGTVFYGTTDAERDAETETRFIFAGVTADYEKIKLVNEKTLDSDIDRLVTGIKRRKKISWLKVALSHLYDEYDKHIIWNPYLDVLMGTVDGIDIVDHESPRSMRDIKRLKALTECMTWFHAEQRKKIEYGGYRIIISEPSDLLETINYTQDFFNQTFEGIDPRLNNLLKILDKSVNGWTARDEVQREIGVSLNTIKSQFRELESSGLVEWKRGSDLNYQSGIHSFDGNKVYYKRCHKGIKKVLIRCQIKILEKLISIKHKEITDTFLLPLLHGKNTNSFVKTKGVNSTESLCRSPKNEQIDTFPLTPLNLEGKK